MSMTPPPGWYPDPSAPYQERWWDGTAWTEHARAPLAPVPVPVPASGGGRGRAIALTAAAAVLVAAIVTGALVLGEQDGGPAARTPAPGVPSPAPSAPAPAPSTASPAPSADGRAVVEDQLNGVTFPLLDGWVRPRDIAQDDVMMTTDGTYECPGDGGVCRHGLVVSRTVTANAERSPKALAEQDIADAADDAYDRAPAGGKPFGGIESHRVVGSGAVAVAGRAGYYVRWRVTTAEGPGGYVQSLVFPSTVGTESPVVVRYVFDAGPDGPPLADMDRITKGIRPAGDPDPGGGVGSGPLP